MRNFIFRLAIGLLLSLNVDYKRGGGNSGGLCPLGLVGWKARVLTVGGATANGKQSQ